MPARGSRKDESLRTVPVSFSLPNYIVEILDKELEASGQASRSKLLIDIIEFWQVNKPAPQPNDTIAEDLERFRNFLM